jgi:hypothetical protein
MVKALLTTKLYIPSVRPSGVSRPRLVERLNEGLSLGRKLTLVSAPAGFGKTTLLSEWVHNCGRPVAWLALVEPLSKRELEVLRLLATDLTSTEMAQELVLSVNTFALTSRASTTSWTSIVGTRPWHKPVSRISHQWGIFLVYSFSPKQLPISRVRWR